MAVTIAWWVLWAVEMYVAVVLLWATWRFWNLFTKADELAEHRDRLQRQCDFWRMRANVLDERLRHYARKRDAKGRFCGRVG